jgi:UDP-sugar transporter A1/2/3
MQELFKWVLAGGILLQSEGSIASVWEKPYEALKVSVPAILYLMQNNLQYLAVGHLDAATYAATYQSKIIWVGILSVVILGSQLSILKWCGLVLLTVGVILIQIGGYMSDAVTAESSASYEARMSGVVYVLSAAVCSSLAGVYFEKILKSVEISVWARNFQLAGYSVITGFVGLYTSSDRDMVLERGLLVGFTEYTWACILMNSFGGLLVGNVIKYADSIQKDIAIGLSIIFSSFASVFLFEFEINRLFVAGMSAVMYAVLLYGEKVHGWHIHSSATYYVCEFICHYNITSRWIAAGP